MLIKFPVAFSCRCVAKTSACRWFPASTGVKYPNTATPTSNNWHKLLLFLLPHCETSNLFEIYAIIHFIYFVLWNVPCKYWYVQQLFLYFFIPLFIINCKNVSCFIIILSLEPVLFTVCLSPIRQVIIVCLQPVAESWQ